MILVLTLAALGLRLDRLTHFEVWVDEAATWWYATLAASGRLGEQMALEPTPPFYYLALGGWMRIFGEGDWAMRLPSALLGALAVPAVYLLGKTWFGSRSGLFGACLIAGHPMHVFYSREARVYPLLLLLTVLLWWRIGEAFASGTRRSWLWVGLLLVLILYSHFYGLFVLAAVGLVALALAPDARARDLGVWTCGLAGLLFLPYLWATLPHLEQSGAAWSIEAMYRNSPEEISLGRVLEQQWIGADYSIYLRQLGVPPTPPVVRWTAILVHVLLLLALWWRRMEAPAQGRLSRRSIAILLVAWLVPVLLPWAWSQVFRPLFHPGRHDVLILGILAVVLGAGLDGLVAGRRRALAIVAALVLMIAAGHRLMWLQVLPASEHYRQPGRWLAERVEPGDRVVACGIRRLATERYARLAGSEVELRSFPGTTDEHPGWADMGVLMQDPVALQREAVDRLDLLQREISDDQRLYVLLQTYQFAEGAASETWLVDRHLIESLRIRGWRRLDDPEAKSMEIAIFAPPGALPTILGRGATEKRSENRSENREDDR